MRNLKIGVRLNLVSLAALVGLGLVLALSLFRLEAVIQKDVEVGTRNSVEIAHSILNHYQKLESEGKMSRTAAQAAARDAIKAIRYSGEEYFFILDMQTRMIALPTSPEIEGQQVGEHMDADGVYLFQEMVDMARSDGEGFVRYHWSEKVGAEAKPKLSYVKTFQPWGWLIATGTYVDNIRTTVMSAALNLGMAVLLVTLLVGALTVWIGRSISVPVAALTRRMTGLEHGDTHSEIPGLDRRDEVGDMAHALDVFRDQAVMKAKEDAGKAEAEAQQNMVVESVSNELARVSRGDLTAEITADFPSQYTAIKDNFNQAIGVLRETVAGLTLSTEAIRSGSDEIAQASDDLARRTESNAASLEQTSAALSQMEERLRATAIAAGSTAERTSEAKTIVGDGRTTADEAVDAMGRVAGGAQGIDSVIEGLDKIAFQTQVLAMNAAVEAGRAGEAGRGFAVVADLVSALARRSEEEARRAREELTATQVDIATAVEAVHKVDGALANIMDSVEQVHELVSTMAKDNQVQSATISEITVAVGAMDTSTQQNAAMVEETSAATRNLASEVAALSENAARFKTGAATPIKPRAVSVAASAVPISHAPIAAPVAMPAAAAAVVADDDDWADF